jgi:PAS domain S-box-containing protein
MSLEALRTGPDPFPYLQDPTGMSARIRNHNWADTTVGDPSTWPQTLHSAVNIALNSGFPLAVYWGEDYTLIYNDAWSSIPGNKHPWALGRPGKEVWSDIWDGLEDQFTGALHEGKLYRVPESLLFMQRFGYTEECYFDYSLSPIRDVDGNIHGVFNAGVEITYRVLNERRNRILNQFAKSVNVSRSRREAYTLVNGLLDSVMQDIPFCLLYSFNVDKFIIENSTGVEPEVVQDIAWPIDLVQKQSIVIRNLQHLIKTPIATYWPEPCEEAMIVPLRNSIGAFSGFVVAGISPRKRLDKEYKNFIESVSGYIGTIIANGGVFEDEATIRKQLVQREESLRRKVEEQLKLVTLVNNSIELMSILELDGKNSYINPAGMRMLGFDNFEQVLTTPIAHLHEPEDIAFVQANVLPAVMNHGKWSGQMNVRHLKTGEVFPVFNNAIRIDDPQTGNTIAIGAVMRDLRGEIATQRALVESEKNLRNIITHSPVAMCIMVGPDYVIDIANEKMIELWGKTRGEVLNKPLFEAIPEARRQGFEEYLHEVYTTGTNFRANEREARLPRNGSIESVYLNFAYEPYRDSKGNVIGILAIAIEVTEQVVARRKIEEEVERRTKELAEANATLTHINDELTRTNINLGEFAYAASHDLKEPARKIHVFADRLQSWLKDRLNDQETHYFQRLTLASTRMTNLINDLLLYSEVNQEMVHTEMVDLNELVQQVLIDLDLEIEQANAQIDTGKLERVRGNKRQLQQVFQNLISNAIKYRRPDQQPRIQINGQITRGYDLGVPLSPAEQTRSFIKVTITDNGVGFEPADAERIFNVFTRLHNDSGYKGTGVGLSIVRKVLQNHNGYVWATSTAGLGSIFTIALPV